VVNPGKCEGPYNVVIPEFSDQNFGIVFEMDSFLHGTPPLFEPDSPQMYRSKALNEAIKTINPKLVPGATNIPTPGQKQTRPYQGAGLPS
jgi:hypothetical protein